MIHRQMIPVRVAATVALAVSALGTAALPAAAAVTPSALHFRTSFGFTTDPTVVASISADPSSDTTSFGQPLTAAEVADLRARMAIQDQIDPLANFLTAHADRFGGLLDRPV